MARCEQIGVRRNSAALGFYMMLYGRHWSAPLVLAALAGIIHDRKSAEGQQHNRDEDNK
jgi:hypothetical protein